MKALIYYIFVLSILIAIGTEGQHDVSTLKLLQIVHRHGDRAPVKKILTKNDPFKDEDKYWPQGFDELTAEGKYRLYKLGQYYRNEYNAYLGDKYSPREVYVRSSSKPRCLESVSALLAGAYPPQQADRKWNRWSDSDLGGLWQPFPIETFIPKSNDDVLGTADCKTADDEISRVYDRADVRAFEAQYQDLYKKLTNITGSPIKDLYSAVDFYDTFQIEFDNKLYWDAIGSGPEAQDIISQLHAHEVFGYRIDWDTPALKRLRAGGIVRLLNDNLSSAANNSNAYKLYVYSTHGENVGAIMSALNVFNDNSPPFGTTLLFELHKSSDYFVRIFLQNSTKFDTIEALHRVAITDCGGKYDCPLSQYLESTKHLLYDNFAKECALSPTQSPSTPSPDGSPSLAIAFSLFLSSIALHFIFYQTIKL